MLRKSLLFLLPTALCCYGIGEAQVSPSLISEIDCEQTGAALGDTEHSALFRYRCSSHCNVVDILSLRPGAEMSVCFGDSARFGPTHLLERSIISHNIGNTDPISLCLHDLDNNGVINSGDRGYVSASAGLCLPLPSFQEEIEPFDLKLLIRNVATNKATRLDQNSELRIMPATTLRFDATPSEARSGVIESYQWLTWTPSQPQYPFPQGEQELGDSAVLERTFSESGTYHIQLLVTQSGHQGDPMGPHGLRERFKFGRFTIRVEQLGSHTEELEAE